MSLKKQELLQRGNIYNNMQLLADIVLIGVTTTLYGTTTVLLQN